MNRHVRSVLIAASVLAMSVSCAQAGFQWTAPSASAVNASTAAMNTRPDEMAPRAASAPIAPVQAEAIGTPVAVGQPIATTPDGPASAAPIYGNGMTNDPITWNASAQARANEVYVPRSPMGMPQPIVPQAGMSQVQAAPVAPMMSQDDDMMPQQATMMAPMGNGQYDIAQGFGKDLPLVMAIRQIVPPQYGFVFDQGINVQNHVSWQGGQPWDIVLQNTLAPLGMQASINGNVVSITRGGGGSGVQMASMNTQTMSATTTTMMTPAPAVIQSPQVYPADIDQISQGNGDQSAAAANQANLLAQGTWTAPRNSTLRGILQDWSQRAGVELYWASEYDYPIQSAVSLNGTFEEAVQVLLKGLYDSKPRPMGRLHPNLPNGPAVLVIETRQNSM